MTNEQITLSNLRSRGTLSQAIVAVTLLSTLCLCARSAAASQYFYSGHDATFSNIIMALYITPTPSGNDVTGSVRCGSVLMYVKGALTGSQLTANITSQPSAGMTSIAAATGALTGTLGTSVLRVTTGAVIISGRAVAMSFALMPPSPAPAFAGPPIMTSGQPISPALPSALHLVGGTGFGYTRVALNLDLALGGSSYIVNGTLFVNQLVFVRFSPPRNVQTTIRISGMLTPGTTGSLTVIGAPPGSFPRFIGILGLSGSPFQGFLSGVPALGITGLSIGAHQ